MGGEACEGFGWWGETVAGAGGGGFDLHGGEDAQSTGVAGGDVPFDSQLLGGWEFTVDEGAELVGIKMFG